MLHKQCGVPSQLVEESLKHLHGGGICGTTWHQNPVLLKEERVRLSEKQPSRRR